MTPARPSCHGTCCQKCCFPCAQKAPCDGTAVFVPSVHVAVVTTSSLCFPSTGHVQPWLEPRDEAWGGSFWYRQQPGTARQHRAQPAKPLSVPGVCIPR